ncbi:hypothetical protein L596_023597 [Steinernema carpocapsae]|uniref:Uncharacterized protein n=1 Tax=Steinernema carpocapsae TaxID=34508 RepID=A0A4U5ME45_STECR|nr:hypothetical protein L596_023597 [Steinernema carpocapsae]
MREIMRKAEEMSLLGVAERNRKNAINFAGFSSDFDPNPDGIPTGSLSTRALRMSRSTHTAPAHSRPFFGPRTSDVVSLSSGIRLKVGRLPQKKSEMLQYVILGYILYEVYRMAQMPNFNEASLSAPVPGGQQHKHAAPTSTASESKDKKA